LLFAGKHPKLILKGTKAAAAEAAVTAAEAIAVRDLEEAKCMAAKFEAFGWIRSSSDVAETWWDAGGNFACPDTDSFSARSQNREGHAPLAIHTAAFVHVLVLLAAGFAHCFGESINLT
jgi:hypothetical protein